MLELEGFDILEHLGTGGMASVWRARQRSLDRDVAVKILASRFATTPEDIERFQTEARTAGRLKHHGIVQVYDAIFQNGVYCFVMEYVAGYTVGDWLRRKGRLAEAEVLSVADCVADALDYAWKQHRMVHCDIKPDNVMVDTDGTVKLTDLGLSLTVNAMRVASSAAESAEVFGTPAYIAPELAMGEPNPDCRADMYSLGAMLYHMATGHMLFEGVAEEQVMELQVTGRAPGPRVREPALSVSFCDLVEKLLAKSRQHRHADWHQVRLDIAAARMHRFLPGGPPVPDASTVLPDPQRSAMVHAGSPLHREPPPVRSHSGLVFLAMLVVLAALGALIWHAVETHNAGFPSRPPTDAPEPRVTRSAALLAEAQDWEGRHPTRNAELMARYRLVVEADPAAREAVLAKAAIQRIQRRIAEKSAEVLDTLSIQGEARIRTGDFAGAINAFERYAGPYADETRTARHAHAEELRARQRAAATQAAAETDEREAARRHAARLRQAEEALLQGLAEGGIPGAKARADALAAEHADLAAQPSVQALCTLIREAFEAERAVLRHYEQRIGQVVEVRTRTGTVQGQINQVDAHTGTLLLVRMAGASFVEMRVNLRDLALQERLLRMGVGDTPGLRLARALVAIEYGAFDFARDQADPLPEAVKAIVLRQIPAGR